MTGLEEQLLHDSEF